MRTREKMAVQATIHQTARTTKQQRDCSYNKSLTKVSTPFTPPMRSDHGLENRCFTYAPQQMWHRMYTQTFALIPPPFLPLSSSPATTFISASSCFAKSPVDTICRGGAAGWIEGRKEDGAHQHKVGNKSSTLRKNRSGTIHSTANATASFCDASSARC